MSKNDFQDNPKKFMAELDDLVNFLADGPEAQQEMKLAQDELFSSQDSFTAADETKDGTNNGIDSVPVLTASIDSETPLENPLKNSAEIDTHINNLIDEVVDKLVPKLEAELRRRLKNKISDPSV